MPSDLITYLLLISFQFHNLLDLINFFSWAMDNNSKTFAFFNQDCDWDRIKYPYTLLTVLKNTFANISKKF